MVFSLELIWVAVFFLAADGDCFVILGRLRRHFSFPEKVKKVFPNILRKTAAKGPFERDFSC